MDIQRIAVIGAGIMGEGIAQIAAQAGYRVLHIDKDQTALDRATKAMDYSLERLCSKGAVGESKDLVLSRIQTQTSFDGLGDMDVVIEAIYERIDVKHALFKEIEPLLADHAILTTNTSTIPMETLAEALERPERLVGTHFFTPVQVNPLLELIKGSRTDEGLFEIACDLGERLGKHVLRVKKDVPGFIMNRLTGAMCIEAMHLIETGAASVEDIDEGLHIGYGYPLGPLGIADLAGLDVCLDAFTNIWTLDGKPDGKKPPEILKRMVAEGKLGRKTGEGFYKYDARGKMAGVAVVVG